MKTSTTYELALLNAENALRKLIDVCPDNLIESESRNLISKLNAARIALIMERKKREKCGCGRL